MTTGAMDADASRVGTRDRCARDRRAEAGLDVSDVVRVVRAALDEDFGYGADVTSAATVAGRTVTADVVAREAGVVAGLPVALAVFDLLADYLGGAAGDASEMTRILRAPMGALCIPHHWPRVLTGPGRRRP